MFQLYLFCVITFLIPICYIVLLEIVKLFKRSTSFKTLCPSDTNQILQTNEVLSLAKIYMDKKQWLSCILMLEFYARIDSLNIADYYNSIGFCYQFMKLNQLAKKYYSKSVKIAPSNILFLKNLAKIYMICKDFQNAIRIYRQILTLDSANEVALSNINSLYQYDDQINYKSG